MNRLPLLIKEVETHFKVLDYVTATLPPVEEMDFSDYELLTRLDSFAFQFLKVQSAMGEKLFPEFFQFLTGRAVEEVTFIDILNTLEKYGFLSAERWKSLRKLRNAFVHIYPWNTEEKKEALKEAFRELPYMRSVFNSIKNFLKKRGIIG